MRNTKLLRRKQSGLTMISWTFVISIMLFLVMLSFKLIPVYLDHFAIKNVMQTLKDEPGSHKMTPKKVRTLFQRRLKINGVYDFDSKNLTIKRQDGAPVMILNYEVRKPMAGNVDAVITFSETVAF